MKNSKIKKILIIITACICLIVAGAYIAITVYVNDYYHAKDVTQGVLTDKYQNLKITYTDDLITFMPTSDEVTTGIILYPGAKVEFTAYAPLMESLAEENIACFIVHMPGNLAMFDMDAAAAVKEANPNITSWYIAGHSLGGAMASAYISEHASEYDGLILLASYSTKDLTDSGLKVLSIYGSNDQVLSKESYEENRSNLPADTVEYVIPGGNHAMFGDYGPQDGDGEAQITPAMQVDITKNRILELIK